MLEASQVPMSGERRIAYNDFVVDDESFVESGAIDQRYYADDGIRDSLC